MRKQSEFVQKNICNKGNIICIYIYIYTKNTRYNNAPCKNKLYMFTLSSLSSYSEKRLSSFFVYGASLFLVFCVYYLELRAELHTFLYDICDTPIFNKLNRRVKEYSSRKPV